MFRRHKNIVSLYSRLYGTICRDQARAEMDALLYDVWQEYDMAGRPFAFHRRIVADLVTVLPLAWAQLLKDRPVQTVFRTLRFTLAASFMSGVLFWLGKFAFWTFYYGLRDGSAQFLLKFMQSVLILTLGVLWVLSWRYYGRRSVSLWQRMTMATVMTIGVCYGYAQWSSWTFHLFNSYSVTLGSTGLLSVQVVWDWALVLSQWLATLIFVGIFYALLRYRAATRRRPQRLADAA